MPRLRLPPPFRLPLVAVGLLFLVEAIDVNGAVIIGAAVIPAAGLLRVVIGRMNSLWLGGVRRRGKSELL